MQVFQDVRPVQEATPEEVVGSPEMEGTDLGTTCDVERQDLTVRRYRHIS